MISAAVIQQMTSPLRLACMHKGTEWILKNSTHLNQIQDTSALKHSTHGGTQLLPSTSSVLPCLLQLTLLMSLLISSVPKPGNRRQLGA